MEEEKETVAVAVAVEGEALGRTGEEAIIEEGKTTILE